MTIWQVLLAGGLVGLGLSVLVAGLSPTHPELHAALARLSADPGVAVDRTEIASEGRPLLAAARRRLLPQLAESLGLSRYASDLRMVGQTPEDLAARKVGYAILGLTFPALLALGFAALGVPAPIAIPAGASLLLAGLLFVLPDVDVRRRATQARASMRRAVCVYLELVALERAADAGTTEALDRAANIGNSTEFDRIRDALLHADLSGQPAWNGLTDLAQRTGVPELGDLADITRLSGQDGAAVYATLRARAASLRTQLLTAGTAKANAASEHMIVPVALLGVAFMALIGYPAFARILFG